MNYSTLALVMGENVKAVGIRFMNNAFAESDRSKIYTYKTSLDLAVDDLVVVNVSGKLKVVKVVEVDRLIGTSDDVEYKWVVTKLDITAYEQNLAIEKELIRHVQSEEVKHRRKQVLESMGIAPEIKAITFK